MPGGKQAEWQPITSAGVGKPEPLKPAEVGNGNRWIADDLLAAIEEDRQPLDSLAEKYRRDGYDVQIQPQPSDFPAFLADTPVDLLARKGDHVIALRVKERNNSSAETRQGDAP